MKADTNRMQPILTKKTRNQINRWTGYQLHEELGLDSPRRFVLGVAALWQQRINLVNEDDGGLMYASDGKQRSNHLLTFADLHRHVAAAVTVKTGQSDSTLSQTLL